MADTQDWSSNANEVTHIKLKHTKAKASIYDVQFHPIFTYPIFGDEESIFGYRGLKIILEFSADQLRPKLNISHSAQFKPVGDVKPDDIEKALKEVLPSLDEPFSEESTENPFIPPGELIHTYALNGRKFGIWRSSLADPIARNLLQDAQALILFFIEGGCRIDLEDPLWTIQRWKVFFVYAIDTLPSSSEQLVYSLVGYSTSYRLYFLDTESAHNRLPFRKFQQAPQDWTIPSAPTVSTNLPARERISQFLILPPYQGKGHGAHLYNTIIITFMDDNTTKEITVEDPNESFDDLRDVNDLIRLRRDSDFSSLKIEHSVKISNRNEKLPTSQIVPTTTIADLRAKYKIASRQFGRLVEMQLLSNIPVRHRQVARITRKDKASDEHDRAYYFWRLFVKHRLYKHNIDSLADLEPDDRVEKLDEALSAVEPDYVRLLGLADRRAVQVDQHSKHANHENKTESMRGEKRRRVLDDEEEEEEEEEDEEGDEEAAAGVASSKDEAANGTGGPRSNVSKKRMKVTFVES